MINKCICFGKPFEYLRRVSIEKELTDVHQLMKVTKCGSACRKCLPYLKTMMETGKTEFEGTIERRRRPGRI